MSLIHEARVVARRAVNETVTTEDHRQRRILGLAFGILDGNTAIVRELLERLTPFLEECKNWPRASTPQEATVSLQVLAKECADLLDIAAQVDRITKEVEP